MSIMNALISQFYWFILKMYVDVHALCLLLTFWRCMSDLSLDHNLEHPFQRSCLRQRCLRTSLEAKWKRRKSKEAVEFQKPKGQPLDNEDPSTIGSLFIMGEGLRAT